MPVTLSGNTHSQPEHPQSTEPTKLSGTELGLNREARSPWTCMRKKGQCLSSIHTSVVRSVGPSPNMNTATIVAVCFVFLFFSTATLLMWNADALIKSQLKQFYNQICRVIYFSVQISTTDILLLPQQRQEKSNLPIGVIIGTMSNGNKLRTLADLIILNDMLLAAH